MKSIAVTLTFTAAFYATSAQQYQVTERGLHHRVWEKKIPYQDARGRERIEKHSYTELATGLMYEENGQLLESSDVIELFKDGAIARRGQHKVIFPANLNAPEGLDYESVDKQRFRSHILGISYYEVPTGRSVMIGELKDCQGFVHPPNVVVYADALSDVKAEIRYRYTRAGFSQDVVLLESPPSPAEYGLDPSACRLEIFTEFGETPEPTKKMARRLPENRPGRGEIPDEELQFGQMRIGHGKAFLENGNGDVPVGKVWTKIDGRQFLIEAIDYPSVKPHLDLLPAPGVAAIQKANAQKLAVRNGRTAPPKRVAKVDSKPIQMAKAEAEFQGPRLVMDYEILNGSTNGFTFHANRTYYVADSYSAFGTIVFEGGSVIKFTNGTAGSVSVWHSGVGAVTFQTDRYRPVVFTSMHDNTIGESIASSTGNPTTNYCGAYCLQINATGGNTNPVTVSNVRFSHANKALRIYNGSNHVVMNAQFIRCQRALEPEISYVNVRNGLFHNVVINAQSSSGGLGGVCYENVTVHNADWLVWTNLYFLAINSVFVGVTNGLDDIELYNDRIEASESGVFNPVGAGAHYLADGSPSRNAGTTNINATLLAELRQRTTYPPIVAGQLATLANTNLSLFPQAGRDTDTPDIGYHYAPIDYVFGGVYLDNSTVIMAPGTVLAVYTPTNGGGNVYGIGLGNAAKLLSEGSPTNLNRIVRYNTVQEQGNTTWNTPAKETIISAWEPAITPETRFRFTEWSIPAADADHYSGYWSGSGPGLFIDCQFYGGKLQTVWAPINLTNCLLHRVYTSVFDSSTDINPTFRNCLFYGGSVDLTHELGGTWTIKDNVFDRVAVSRYGALTHDYNGYITNASAQWLTNSGGHDVFTNMFTWQNGTLGKFYQSTNSPFIGKGSTNADLLALYHYTVVTNNVKETNSMVDCGFHYLATSSGVPIDTDGDGIPDYLEDANGNGSINSGETGLASATDQGLKVLITRPRNGSILP